VINSHDQQIICQLDLVMVPEFKTRKEEKEGVKSPSGKRGRYEKASQEI